MHLISVGTDWHPLFCLLHFSVVGKHDTNVATQKYRNRRGRPRLLELARDLLGPAVLSVRMLQCNTSSNASTNLFGGSGNYLEIGKLC